MDYEKLKEVIAKQIKENGKREITGPVLQAVLMAMVDSLGEVYPHTYTDEEKARARANIDALSNHNGEITKEKLSLEVQAILNDVANKQNISDATLATIAKTIVGAINEVYKGGLEDASIATSKIEDGAVTDAKIANGAVTTPKIANDAVTTEKVYDGAITEPKLDTDLVNIITSAVQPAGLASAIATALASYVAKADIVDTTGSATDKVMSQHGVTEAIDGVTNKVTELESNLGYFGSWERGYYYNAEGKKVSFSSDAYGVLSPIDVSNKNGEKYTISVALESSGLAFVSFLDASQKPIAQYRPQSVLEGVIPIGAVTLLVCNRFYSSSGVFNEYPSVSISGTNSQKVAELQSDVANIKSSVADYDEQKISVTWEDSSYYNNNAQKIALNNWQSAKVDVSDYVNNIIVYKVYTQKGGGAFAHLLDDKGGILWSKRLWGGKTDIADGAAVYEYNDDFVVANNAKYLLLSNNNFNSAHNITNPAPYVAKADLSGIINVRNLKKNVEDIQKSIDSFPTISKISFLGDSITEGVGASATTRYSALVAKYFDAIENNLGVAGTALAKNAYNRDNSSRFIARATSSNLENSSLIVIFGGTNDFSYDIKPIGNLFAEETISTNGRIGSKKLVPPSDTETFAGALHELILAVKKNCPNTPIMLVTPINRGRFTSSSTIPTSEESNINGNFLNEFKDAILKIGKYYSIPVLELNDTRLDFTNVDVAAKYSSDNLHPNAAGARVIAEIMIRFIKNMYL